MEELYISVIIPVFNEADSVRLLHGELDSALKLLERPYEIIFIDDGSRDETAAVLAGLGDSLVRVERFENNRGKSAALTRGFAMAGGEVIITMDGDLQDDPKEIPRFIDALRDHDMISGWRYVRQDPPSKTLPSMIYNFLTRLLTGIDLHDLNSGYKAYRRDAVTGLTLSGGMHRYIAVLVLKKGFRVGEIKVAHRPRLHGTSKYGPFRLLAGIVGLLKLRFFEH